MALRTGGKADEAARGPGIGDPGGGRGGYGLPAQAISSLSFELQFGFADEL